MDNNIPSYNNVYESNFTGFNNYSNNLPPTVITQAENPLSNINCYNDVNGFCNYSYNYSMINDNIFPVHTPVTHSNNVNSDHNYQQSMSNDASTSQCYLQHIDQNPPQPNIVPTLNSLNITINSPHTNIS